MRPILVVGTSSDAGKTSVVMALCRIFSDLGWRVAPFKAQNVSNNSCVTLDGREISRAQYFQAQAARVEASHLFNPVLLKSHGSGGVHVIVNGLPYKNQAIADYFEEIEAIKGDVKNAFTTLVDAYDVVIAEGAGSPVELNLLAKDLSNTFIAKTFKPRIILVADIERGGVFASIYGTLALLAPEIRENVVGVIINKFRGDRRFFNDGEAIITQQFGVPVLGVLPFLPLNIDMEDSQSLQNYQQRRGHIKIKLAVIATPRLSNYTDLDVLMADEEIEVTLIHQWQSLEGFDMVLLAGSKSVISDLRWLKENGLFAEILRFQKSIFGICGGYQMLCETLVDNHAQEASEPSIEQGFALIADTATYFPTKTLKRGIYRVFDEFDVEGYEIHCGQLAKYPLYYQSGRITGTHIHGIFDNNALRTAYFRKISPHYLGFDYAQYREHAIHRFTNMVRENLDLSVLL
ncbi:MAG TPA: cobyric acid synthase CobQ [Methylococcaceae bacterium]|nr:cobyric acid synthase CobQ [Methylococcaceae bacterium]